jgi:REP element-mobilizing transposase RayT
MKDIQGGYKNVRLKNYDYTTGWFFVTNKSDFGKHYFIGNIYQLLRRELIELIKLTDGVGLDFVQIMPNHIHVILIFDNSEITLPTFWRKYKALTTFKAHKIGFKNKTLWQSNYFEHIIRSEYALNAIRRYIQKNPYEINLPLHELYEEVKISVR